MIADFSFHFLFFLGNGWEGRRINYNLPSEKTSFAWTSCNVGNLTSEGFDLLDKIVSEGKVQFMESLTLSAPYMVRVSIPDLNIRRGPGTLYQKTGKFTGVGIFTVVEEKDGWGLLKAYQEGRDGWISLAFTTRI